MGQWCPAKGPINVLDFWLNIIVFAILELINTFQKIRFFQKISIFFLPTPTSIAFCSWKEKARNNFRVIFGKPKRLSFTTMISKLSYLDSFMG